jgi:hypothetical protein
MRLVLPIQTMTQMAMLIQMCSMRRSLNLMVLRMKRMVLPTMMRRKMTTMMC